MSQTGASERSAEAATPRTTLVPPPRPDAAANAPAAPPDSPLQASFDAFFIPDFCAPRMVFAVVLIAELVALTLTLARPDTAFLTELARISMFLQWLGLTSAALLCYSRRWLARLTVAQSSSAAFALLLANTAVISLLALWLGTAFGADGRVSARIDCNRGSGSWKSDGKSQIEFGPMAVTRAMCPPGSMDMHDHILKQMPHIRSYVIKDGHLFLSLMADGGTYELEPAR